MKLKKIEKSEDVAKPVAAGVDDDFRVTEPA
jgi:hypothetical protein